MDTDKQTEAGSIERAIRDCIRQGLVARGWKDSAVFAKFGSPRLHQTMARDYDSYDALRMAYAGYLDGWTLQLNICDVTVRTWTSAADVARTYLDMLLAHIPANAHFVDVGSVRVLGGRVIVESCYWIVSATVATAHRETGPPILHVGKTS